MSETKRLSLKNCSAVPWLENPEGRDSPIGSMLEELNIHSGIGTHASPLTTIHLQLMGNMHDGKVKLTYHRVRQYSIEGFGTGDPYGNIWIEDTLKLTKADVLKHKVTFSGGSWSIEAEDIEFSWEPL